MKASLLPLVMVILGAPFAAAAVDPSGHWEGVIKVPSGPSRLTLDLAHNDQTWIASLGVPERKVTGLVVEDLKVVGDVITFSSPDMPDDPTFELTLHENKLNGTLWLHGRPLPIELRRTGEPKVEIEPRSPAVSPELDGDWEGTLTLPDGKTRPINFHFHNQVDHTVVGTLDSPSQGAFNLGLAGITDSDHQVAFHVRIHGGSFKGTLNAEGSELAGDWTQTPGAPALPCKMKKKTK